VRLKTSGYLGAQCIFYVPKEKKSKLDPLGRKDTFMGYSEIFEDISDLHPWSETN
jgi:hypothetical protein